MKKRRGLFTIATFLISTIIWSCMGIAFFPVSNDNTVLAPDWYYVCGTFYIIISTIAVNIFLKLAAKKEAESQTEINSIEEYDISNNSDTDTADTTPAAAAETITDDTVQASNEVSAESTEKIRALFCKYCGTKLPDDAAYCPHCGSKLDEATDTKAPVSDFKEGVIHVYWADPEGHVLGKNRVFVDGVKVGKVRCGGTLDVTVSAGVHTVSIYELNDLLIEETIDINASNPEEIFAYATVLNRFGFRKNMLRVNRELPGPNFIRAPICPACGSQHVGKISTTGRFISVGIVGLASSSVGKTFYCKSCGYKW